MRALASAFPLLLIGLIVCPAQQQAIAYDENSSFTVFYPSKDFSKIGDATTQAKESGFADYSSVVKRAAMKNANALKRLFYIDTKASWDAGGGETKISVMRQMLLIWGDYDFAQILASQTIEVQKGVSSNFRVQPYDRHFAILFPRTAAISDRVWPKR